MTQQEAPFPRPAQLPAVTGGFAGRVAEVAEVVTQTADEGSVTLVVGMPGVGKTTLALHCAHRLAERFPDGQLYLDLHGFGPAESVVTPAQALRHLLWSLGVRPERTPAEVDEQSALFRSLAAGRRMLIVLDNARDAEQVRPLLAAAPTCRTVVTSRAALTDLVAREAAVAMTLAPLPDDGSRELLSRRLGAARIAAEPAAIADIVRACAGLPLTLAMVAARAAGRPAVPLSVIASELSGGVTADPATLLAWSYQALSPGAARLFRLFGLLPGPSADRAAVASLADLDDGAAGSLLDELAQGHLITEVQPGRFAMHDLIRAYAAGLAVGTDSATDRRAALYRLLARYYQGRVIEATYLIARGRHPVTGMDRPYFAGRSDASAWLAAERAALLATVTTGQAAGFHDLVVRLAETLDAFLDMTGWREDRVALQRTAVAAARAAGNLRVQADTIRNLGLAERGMGRNEHALNRLRESLELSHAAGDARGEARTFRVLGILLGEMGRQQEAHGYTERAVDLLRDLGGTGLANALNELGYAYAETGDYAPARKYCLEALEASAGEAMPERTRAATLDSLGYIEHLDGNLDEAAAYYRAAVDLRREIGERSAEASSLLGLGQVTEDAGDPAAAARVRSEAVVILEDLGHPDADAVRSLLP